MENNFDLGIIGGGPAGYSAAIRAAQKGLSVIVFEKEQMGGVCLNKGCIPTKTILHCSDFYKNLKKAEKFGIEISDKSYNYEKIFNRKNEIVEKLQKSLTKLVQSYGVEIINAEAKIDAKDKIEADGKVYQCKNIILATGSKPAEIRGLERDGKFILNSDDILNLSQLPENILITGSGAIGVEWARIFSALDKKVTVVELADRLLPNADADLFVEDKPIVVDSKVLMLDVYDEMEAYYVCGIINSPSVIEVVDGYAISTNRGVDVLKYIAIAKYDEGNEVHRSIAEISKNIHEKMKESSGKANITQLENALNEEIHKLFS